MKAFLLAISIAILGCGSTQLGGGGRVDRTLAALVPADTILLSGIRMNELRSTPLYGKMIAQQRLSELNDFAKQTNFDPRKDVNDMLVASNGADIVVLARGNFKVPPPGAKKSAYKGATIYGGADGAFAILDPSTAVAGVERAVRKAIDQKQSGQQGAAALLSRAGALQGPGQVWFVSSGWGTLPDKLSSQGGNLSNFSRIFRSVEKASGTADLRSGVSGVISGDCRTEPDAKTLGDAARGMVGLGRLSVPENQPEMLRLFDGIKVEQKQQSVQVNINIQPDLIDKLLKLTETRVPGKNR